MDLSSPSFGTEEITTRRITTAKILEAPPTNTNNLLIPDGLDVVPGQLCAYYYDTLGIAEMYIVNAAGTKFLRLASPSLNR